MSADPTEAGIFITIYSVRPEICCFRHESENQQNQHKCEECKECRGCDECEGYIKCKKCKKCDECTWKRPVNNDLLEGMKLLGNEKDLSSLGIGNKLKTLKTLLFFSDLVYKRNTKITPKIQKCVRKLKKYGRKVYKDVYETLCILENDSGFSTFKNMKRKIGDIISRDNEINDNILFEDIELKIRKMIGKDEEDIKKQIEDMKLYIREMIDNDFDLNFTTISELNSDDGGSYCGMSWSIKENFIVVTFKGTSPTNFAEWLSNLTFQCVDARNYLSGQVHRGFYNCLFPTDEESAGKNYPCQRVIEYINHKAEIFKRENKKANLWITGHSLGGAFATLFYARLLNINYSHESLELRGAVTFASPAVGDINFATQLGSLIKDPRNSTKHLWRVVLNDDIVPKMPYRACDKRMRKYGYHYNVLMNYAQVGDKITFYGGEHKPTSVNGFFNKDVTNNNNHIRKLESYCNQEKKSTPNKLRYFRCRHGTDKYFEALNDYEKKLNNS
ncbi:alpha/beta hydrolase protein [Rhizophagus clarus]|uniref:Alpha/beta hydrolase protein n=1 Tax=Rhizophagus clarus TaxID=94130 RepID=A0A8H3QGI4_9GLOM|nr:alpha/beta hydrolase protein [Rhizophagus clarus]